MTQPQPYTPNDHPDVVTHRQAIRAEYERLIAVQDIPIGQALAYRAGDPIPESNSDAYGYEARGLAVERDSDEGRAVLARVTGLVETTGAAPASAMQALALASADDLAPMPKRRPAAKAAVAKATTAKATPAASTQEGEG